MSNGTDSAEESPEPAQKLLYHATGKLYRYLARFAGEDPDDVEQAYHDSFEAVTSGADPILIGDAIDEGVDLGFSLAERRRALRRYHDELVRQQLAPPAYDTERLEGEDGEIAGLRVLISGPDCRFFTDRANNEVLVRTPTSGEVEVPLAFDPGPIETVDAGESVTEVIVRPAGWTPGAEADDDVGDEGDSPQEPSEEDAGPVGEYLDAAREVVLEDPGRALLAAERGGSDTGRLVATLLERKPSAPIEEAPDIVDEAIHRVGIDTLEARYDEIVAAHTATEDDASDEADMDDDAEVDGEKDDEPPPEIEEDNG